MDGEPGVEKQKTAVIYKKSELERHPAWSEPRAGDVLVLVARRDQANPGSLYQ